MRFLCEKTIKSSLNVSCSSFFKPMLLTTNHNVIRFSLPQECLQKFVNLLGKLQITLLLTGVVTH